MMLNDDQRDDLCVFMENFNKEMPGILRSCGDDMDRFTRTLDYNWSTDSPFYKFFGEDGFFAWKQVKHAVKRMCTNDQWNNGVCEYCKEKSSMLRVDYVSDCERVLFDVVRGIDNRASSIQNTIYTNCTSIKKEQRTLLIKRLQEIRHDCIMDLVEVHDYVKRFNFRSRLIKDRFLLCEINLCRFEIEIRRFQKT